MTTMTLNAYSAPARGVASSKKASFIDIRAALPDMPVLDSAASIAIGVAGRAALAAVPFAALSWLFVSV